MKTLKQNLGMPALFLAFIIAFQLTVKGEEFTKTLKEKYNVKSGAVLHIENKFGNVVCNNWDEQAISIDVTITVEASGQTRANEIFEKIHVSLSGNDSRVEGITKIDEMGGNKKFSIDYNINMPRDINAELSHKYGNMIVEDIDGSSKIEMKYGDLQIENLNSLNNSVSLKYGDGEIEYINKGKVEVKYSDFELEKTGTLELDSKYNDINIEKVGILDLNTGYDDVDIEEADVLKSYARFTDIKIYKLNQSFDSDMEYGGCKIRNVKKGFKDIRITGKHTDINIGFEQGASYRVYVETSYSSFDYPRTKGDVSRTELSHTSAKYEGIIGPDKSTDSRVYIQSKYGGVELY